VGALAVDGEDVPPVSQQVEIVDSAAIKDQGPKAAETIYQPPYSVMDTSLFDLTAESASEVSVSAIQDGTARATDAEEIGPQYLVGPEHVFEMPQRVWLPVPEGTVPETVQILCYCATQAGTGWYPANAIEGLLADPDYLAIEIEGVTYLGLVVKHGCLMQLVASEPAKVEDTAAAVIPSDVYILGSGLMLLLLAGRLRRTQRAAKR
jgi:hypothetical protein